MPIVSFIPVISEAKTKNTAISEVDQEGLQISRLITQNIRNAISITSPAIGTSANSLSLTTSSQTNPVVFGLTGDIF